MPEPKRWAADGFNPVVGARAAAAGRKDAKLRRQAQLLNHLRRGLSFNDSAAAVGVDPQTVRLWLRADAEFRGLVDPLRRGEGVVKFHGMEGRPGDEHRLRVKEGGGFPFFEREYMSRQVFPHQQNVVDAIEGRTPSWLHPAMTYQPGSRRMVLINMPPEHAKSATFTVDYVVYRVLMNPDIRIKIIAANLELAKQFLYAISQRLKAQPGTRWAVLNDFMPEGGFEAVADAWNKTEIYLGNRESVEKDPTVQALGVGGQIYGARADLILGDDLVSLRNAHQWQEHERWIKQEVRTRLGPTGSLIVLGTRVAPYDLYAALGDGQRFTKGVSPWTYLAMPALLDESDPDVWETLWPRSDQPFDTDTESEEVERPDSDGLFRRWDTNTLGDRRDEVDARTWALAYQQQTLSETATFHAACISACIQPERTAGQLPAGWDRDDVFMFGGLDPAMSGFTAAMAIALHQGTGELALVDAINMPHPSPKDIRDLIIDWGGRYKFQEWVIERNAFQAYLTRDDELQDKLREVGVRITEHQTNAVNKYHAEWGVAGMSTLFGSLDVDGQHRGDQKLWFPAREGAVRNLCEQLAVWYPGANPDKVTQDCVMALWFAVTRAKQMGAMLVGSRPVAEYRVNPYQRAGVMDARARKQRAAFAKATIWR